MGKLIYSLTTSLDGYVAGQNGNIEWTAPSEEVLAFVDHVLHNVGTFLLGRRMHETLAIWDTIAPNGPSEGMNQFSRIWQAADKIVYSAALTKVSTANTIIEHVFNTEAVEEHISKSDKDFNIGGPHLAAAAIRAGIVDELHQYIVPKIIGNGTSWLPKKFEADFELVELQQFANGYVHLHYRPIRALPQGELR